MARIPTPESVSGPASLRPVGPAPVADMSGLARGVENLAGSVGRIVQKERDKQNTIDLASADAYATKEWLNLQNSFQQDGDYATFADRAETGTNDIAAKAGEMIRDENMRARWLAQHETQRVQQVDAINDMATKAANEAERVRFADSLADYAKILEEPNPPVELRNQARISMQGAIDVAVQTGLLSPAEAAEAERNYIDRAEQSLAINTADALIRANPEAVINGMGINPNPDDPMDATRTAVRLPVIASDGVNVRDLDPGTLTRWEQVQGAFGQQLQVISATRDPAHNDAVGGASGSQHLPGNGSKAIDIDVSSLSKEERIRLIETASAMGMNGIGVYGNSLHFDTGARRAWGPSHGSDSVPAWARDVIDRHTSGQIAEVPVAAANVDPRFAALDYQQRAALFDKAKQEVEKRNMEVRASIETTAENAPYAISRQGSYDGYMPTANDFVTAYGVRDGLAKYESFDASVQVAQDTFAMRTMSADEIAAVVSAATPTSTGDDAALQEKSFAAISSAAQATIKAREEDPAGYVQQVYPAVAAAWQGVEDQNPASFQRAITVTAMAQTQLGMEVQPLPKNMADNVAATFNDPNLPGADRVGALTSVVMATNKPDQQAAIFGQLVEAGVPQSTRAALEALSRGDQGAATRLAQAAMADPETLNKTLPGDIKSAQIDDELQAQIFDVGGIGDIYYDLAYGSIENATTAAADMALMANSVKLRLLDGSAGGNVQRAIDMTVADMFGNVQVISGKSWGSAAGLKALLPSDADVSAYQTGFDALLGQVGDAMARDMQRDIGDIPGGGAQQAISERMVAN